MEGEPHPADLCRGAEGESCADTLDLVVAMKIIPSWSGSRGVAAPAGPSFYPTSVIIPQLSVFCLVKYRNYLYNSRVTHRIGTTSDMEVNVQRLRALRSEHVLTLRELAEEAGVSKDTVWRLENGHSEAHPSTIRKLARALGVQPRELVKTGGSNG
jgi:DNA-binding XRE family transcriptional regulator